MKALIIKQATLIEPGHKLHGKKTDLLIEKGIITKIAPNIALKTEKTIEGKDLHVSSGWIDLRAQFCDPGEEYKETLDSGTKAAAAGGFTSVNVLPALTISRDNKAAIEYIKRNSGLNGVNLIPVGNLSKSGKGEELAEMYDMKQSGAVFFSDDRNDLSSGLLKKALLYAKDIGARLMIVPFDSSLVINGQMHEGEISTKNGLKGWPDLVETTRIERDLNILRYTGGSIHFSLISSAASVKLIEKAKKEGLDVTCDVAAHNLVYTEEHLNDFNSLYKVYPPLRSEKDRKTLIKAVETGIIDAVCSDHMPQDSEHKEMEFEYAHIGIAGIQTAFHHLLTAGLSPESIVMSLSKNPARILNTDTNLSEGTTANLTVFDLKEETDLTKNYFSLSPYNPLKGKKTKGKIVATLSGGKIIIQ